jgi:hypothetical protein
VDISYGREKFSLAVLGMAQSARPLRQRLRDAYLRHLVYVHDENIPEGSRRDMAELRHMLTHRPPRTEREGNADASTDQMSDDEADRAARLIIKILDDLSVAQES